MLQFSSPWRRGALVWPGNYWLDANVGGIDFTCYEALCIDHTPVAMSRYDSSSAAVPKLLQFVVDLHVM
jgi:hypothetical protein